MEERIIFEADQVELALNMAYKHGLHCTGMDAKTRHKILSQICPANLSDLIKEKLGKAFTAGYHYGITLGDTDANYPDKEQYLQSL